jgi:hypothetical protein
VSHAHALQQELTALCVESARQLEAIRQEQERQTSEFQRAIAARDASFRAELGTATQRLESAQAHMLQEIDDGRKHKRPRSSSSERAYKARSLSFACSSA